jgi:hypothetical protein
MHFEALVEDQSGARVVELFLEKILGPNGKDHSYTIHEYKGLGRLPKNLRDVKKPFQRILLDRLPALLRGYGRSLQPDQCVLVVVDLDDRDCMEFKGQLLGILESFEPRPRTLFRIAIEEIEAWLLGDQDAVKKAYPKAREIALRQYQQDAICGTWEKLADAVYPGGFQKLGKLGYPVVGAMKREWAERIVPLCNIDKNQSKSFQVFRDGVLRLAGIKE